jgi:hypothetical protein
MRLKRSCSCGGRSLPRRRPPSVSSTVFGARIGGRHRQLFLAAAAIHQGRDRATPTTPVEIDDAAQVWHLSAHYAQFRAPAFPSSVPCRSRCRAPAGLARARTSHDIRPRALGTPPPKSFAPTPLHPSNDATGIRCGQHGFAPGMHFRADSGLCATANIAGAAARTRKENQCVMNYEQSTSISGKHHPENHKGEWSAPVVRQRARV